MSLQDQEIHLRDYWDILVKRQRVVMTFFALVVGIMAVYSFAATPVYRGTTQILIDLEKNTTLAFTEDKTAYLQMKDPDEYYRTQIEILQSRTFADRVVRKMQLDNNAYFLEKKDMMKNSLTVLAAGWFKDTVSLLFPEKAKPVDLFPEIKGEQELDPDIIDIILDEMKVEVGKGTNIMKIHYDSENPSVAAVMANGVADAYIEHNLDIRVKPFRDAVEWLSARMVDLRAKVESSEKILQQYKENKGIVSFESRESVITQKLAELTSQLVQAEAKRQDAEAKYNQILAVINNTALLTTVPDIMNNLVIQQLRNEELNIKMQISEISEKYGPKHPQMIKAKSELGTVQKNIIVEARKMLSAAKTEFQINKNREISLLRAIEDQKQEVLDVSRKAIDFNVLAGEAESNRQFYELLLKKLQEASLLSGINVSNAQVMDSAIVPENPIKPQRGLNMLFALIFGLFGGVCAVLFVEYMDDTIKSADDIERVLALPILGFVPTNKKNEQSLYMHLDAKSAIAESFRTVRTGIMLSSAEKSPQVILVTSSITKEGKTTTCANLAVAMAHMGERVLLIDADMRRHRLQGLFALDHSAGLSNIIVDHGDFSSVIRTFADIPNLNIITGGDPAPNPLELLSSQRMRELVAGLRKSFDRIILDSPPVTAFSDALILSRLSDGVIMVIGSGMAARDVVKKCSQSFKSIDAKILGVVLNNMSTTKRSYYYPYYDDYYGHKGA